MNKDIVRQAVVVISMIATLVVNYLANALPINGQTSAEISNRIALPIVPANYVFAIWGLIYTLLIAYTVFQALPANREHPLLRRTGWLFALSCVANVGWLFLFHYEFFPLTVLAMGVLLVLLVAIYLRVNGSGRDLSRGETWFIQVPFSTYLGWITVATVVNLAYALADAGWNGFGIDGATWAVALLVVAAAIALTLIMTRGDVAYTAVIVWAFAGIAVKHSEILPVAVTAGLLAVLLAGALVVQRGFLSGGKSRPSVGTAGAA